MRFAEAGREARAEDLQLAALPREPELHAVPIEPGGAMALSGFDRRKPEAADMLGHLGEIVMRQHRDVPEHVVEAVRRLEIVELVALADEIADREHPLGQHREEDFVGDEAGDGNGAPTRTRFQDRVQPLDVRYAWMRQPEQVDPVEEGADDARAEQLDLTREQ